MGVNGEGAAWRARGYARQMCEYTLGGAIGLNLGMGLGAGAGTEGIILTLPAGGLKGCQRKGEGRVCV